MAGRTGMRWVCAVVAPWMLGAGLLVSFTAVASNDPQTGISAAAVIPAGAVLPAGGLVPPSALAHSSLPLPRLRLGALVKEIGEGFDPESAAEVPLRPDMKEAAMGEASVERATKSHPLETFAPSLSRRGHDLQAVPPASRLLFGRDES